MTWVNRSKPTRTAAHLQAEQDVVMMMIISKPSRPSFRNTSAFKAPQWLVQGWYVTPLWDLQKGAAVEPFRKTRRSNGTSLWAYSRKVELYWGPPVVTVTVQCSYCLCAWTCSLSWQMLLAPLHHSIRDHARLTGRHTISHVLAEKAVFGPCLNTVPFLMSADELRDLQLDSCGFPLC